MAKFDDLGFDNSNVIGKKGEKYYTKYANKLGHDVINVSDDSYFRTIDVDLIVANTRNIKLNSIVLRDFKERISREKKFVYNRDSYTLVEVKTDTKCGKSGNIYLEWVAHYAPGCFATTRADKWVYLAWDEETDAPTNMWIIDIPLLRKAIVDGQVKPGTYSDEDVKHEIWDYRTTASRNGKDPGMYAWVVPIEYLIKIGVAIEKKNL